MQTRPWIDRRIGSLLLVAISVGIGSRALGHEEHPGFAPGDDERIAAVTSPTDAIRLSKLAESQLRLARKSAEHADYVAAEVSFRRWIAIEESSESARVGLAYALLGQHRFREALEPARSASRARPGSIEVLALLGDLHLALGNDVEAESFFERLAGEQLDLGSLARLSLIHQYRGRYAEARATMREALEAGTLLGAPAHEIAWCRLMLGELDLSRGRLEEADREFEAALRLDPESHAASWRRAQVARRRGDAETARRMLRDLIRHAPRPSFLRELGQVYQDLGRGTDAQRWLSEAEDRMLAELRQGGIGHARELVELWLSGGRNLERAVELALRDLKEVRQDAAAFETAAWALHQVGRNAEAVPLMDEALRRSKSESRTLWRAGMLFYDSPDRRAEGRQLLELAVRLNPAMELSSLRAARERIGRSNGDRSILRCEK